MITTTTIIIMTTIIIIIMIIIIIIMIIITKIISAKNRTKKIKSTGKSIHKIEIIINTKINKNKNKKNFNTKCIQLQMHETT